MSPMMWFLMFMVFIIIFIMFNIMNYFTMSYTPLPPPIKLLTSKKINWKW